MDFPTFQAGLFDSKSYSIEREDPAMRQAVDGGYDITRARHTRRPRRTYVAVYRNLNQADKTAIEDFWDDVGGGSAIFNWTNPENGTTYQVRFPEAFQLSYTGAGPTKRWDCSIKFKEA